MEREKKAIDFTTAKEGLAVAFPQLYLTVSNM
jgi:hypothetical protein